MPFGLHQGAEYLLAAFLAETALHLRAGTQTALLAGAGAIALLAFLTRGPLGLIRLLPPRLHQIGDVVVLAGLAIEPVVVASGRSLTSILVAEVGAIAVARLAWSTRYTPSPRPVASRRVGPSAQQVVDASARRLGQASGRIGSRLPRR